uniref:ZnMc domain-containing protein n=1 Tax=Steinernema glaseri TaxID=37863 RepID=A0A1I8A1S9_9BILA
MSDHPLSVLLVVILICPSVMAIEDDEVAYLQRFGYVTEDLSTAMISGNFWSDKIKAFQDMADLPQTGEMDLATKQAMKATRCGVPDKAPPNHGHNHRHRHRRLRVKRQYNVYKWPRNELTYWIRNTARSLRDRQAVRREIAEAFRAWSDVSGLTFREVESDDGRDVDIALSFEHGSHGCPSPFARGYLAHAFKYTERYQFSGDVHFNDDYMFKSSPVSNYLNRLEKSMNNPKPALRGHARDWPQSRYRPSKLQELHHVLQLPTHRAAPQTLLPRYSSHTTTLRSQRKY